MLLVSTLVLYAVTSALFHSFTSRRRQTAEQYAEAGRRALAQHRADEAVADFRVALENEPGTDEDRELLADALAASHHEEEATSYYLALRETRPADGRINLQLARLYRRKGDSTQAVEFYRSAALGNWDDDGVEQRRKAQLELCDYLLERGDGPEARVEILAAAANTPETEVSDLAFGDMLLRADDVPGALLFYQKAAHLGPHSFQSLAKYGRLLFQTGAYADAARTLHEAEKHGDRATPGEAAVVRSMAADADRLQELALSPDLPAATLDQHLLTAGGIAKRRAEACAAAGGSGTPASTAASLQQRWHAAPALTAGHIRALAAPEKEALTQLIFETEIETARTCSAPTGDDALLLMLARRAAQTGSSNGAGAP